MVEQAEHERAFESGQYLIDKRRCANAADVLWYAEHSDFVAKHVYGDKECFHLGWRKLGTEYAMQTAGPEWDVHTIVQYDHRGDIVFQHRCQDKWKFAGNRFNDSLRNEQICFDLIADRKTKWDGVLWNNPAPTAAEQRSIDALAGRRFTYRRVGYDEREIAFDPNDLVGESADECERRWSINHDHGRESLRSAGLIGRPATSSRTRTACGAAAGWSMSRWRLNSCRWKEGDNDEPCRTLSGVAYCSRGGVTPRPASFSK